MKYAKKKDIIKAYTAQQIKEKEQQERQDKIDKLEQQIREIDLQLDQYQEISLIGVEVIQAKLGKGVVIDQTGSKIKVQFGDKAVNYYSSLKIGVCFTAYF